MKRFQLKGLIAIACLSIFISGCGISDAGQSQNYESPIVKTVKEIYPGSEVEIEVGGIFNLTKNIIVDGTPKITDGYCDSGCSPNIALGSLKDNEMRRLGNELHNSGDVIFDKTFYQVRGQDVVKMTCRSGGYKSYGRCYFIELPQVAKAVDFHLGTSWYKDNKGILDFNPN